MWRFKITHVPGKSIPASDASSQNPARSPLHDQELSDQHYDSIGVCSIVDQLEGEIIATTKTALEQIQAVTWDRVKDETQADPYLCQLQEYIINGFPDEIYSLPSAIGTILEV